MSDDSKNSKHLKENCKQDADVRPEVSDRFKIVTLPDEVLESSNINEALCIGELLEQLQHYPEKEKQEEFIEIQNSCDEVSQQKEKLMELMLLKEEAGDRFGVVLDKFLKYKNRLSDHQEKRNSQISDYISRINYMRRLIAFLNAHLATDDEENRIRLAKEVSGDLDLQYYRDCLKMQENNPLDVSGSLGDFHPLQMCQIKMENLEVDPMTSF